MDNRNFYNGNQPNGYYAYGYPAASAPLMRPESTTYMLPQPAVAAVLKGRPVTSLEEARVSQIDLDGSIFIFPDFGNKKIYTKKINIDGTAAIQTYELLDQPIAATEEYATKDELLELKQTLDKILNKIQNNITNNNSSNQKINF